MSSNYNLRNLMELLRRFYNYRSSSSSSSSTLGYSWWRSNTNNVANVAASSSSAGRNSSSMVAFKAPTETTKQIRGLQLISCNSLLIKGRLFLHSAADNKFSGSGGAPPSSSVPLSLPQPKYSFTGWVKWALGAIFTIVLPFWKQKWERMKTIEKEAEIVAEEMERVAEVVEKVATVAENMSAQVAESLPSTTNEKLKEAALLVERISKTAAHEAHVAGEFIHKVDQLAHDFDDLENMVDPNPNPAHRNARCRFS